jgi:hypothetical protein
MTSTDAPQAAQQPSAIIPHPVTETQIIISKSFTEPQADNSKPFTRSSQNKSITTGLEWNLGQSIDNH